jgi:ankyrin repeat protein
MLASEAARNGNIEARKLLLEKGAKIEAQDNDGNTPLQKAAWLANAETVRCCWKGAQFLL